ncbi:MAG: hypothetical protein CMI34_03400 [Opitutales bacterium]|nr:hypothetical protein [Opitutales bacterium]|tara:strand:- start:116 stop:838 length:723 start_codon:yes stop_codon:yes gene_type:complete
MTEDKFTELVNLYLDKEISECGLAQLKSELVANAERKDDFAGRCRMHQAMRIALNPQSPRRSYKFWRYGYNSLSSSSHKMTTFPRWIMGTGFAAILALSFALLMPVFRDTPAVTSQPTLNGVEVKDLFEFDMLKSIGHREIRRFVNMQAQRKDNQQASLAAQLRLLGLSPELTPMKKPLPFISEAAAQRPDVVWDHTELLAEVQKMSVMPPPQILRVESMLSEPSAPWPRGFQSSLASFK